MSFTAKGLVTAEENGKVQIKQEGSVKKFRQKVSAVSFSGKNAVKRGQKVLYVTERCVFELTGKGLKLKEVFPGIDEMQQIRKMLDFEC